MPRLRALLWGGLAVAGIIQLSLLVAFARQGPTNSQALSQARPGGPNEAHAVSSDTEELQFGLLGDAPADDNSQLLEFHGKGITLALRLGSGNQSLWWDSTSADLANSDPELEKSDRCRTRKLAPELFYVQSADGATGALSSRTCSMKGLQLDDSSVVAFFVCEWGVSVRWEMRLEKDQHFARVAVELASADVVGRARAPGKLTLLTVPPAAGCGAVAATGSVDGSPVLISKRWFLGVEHPLGAHEMSRNGARGGGVSGVITHLGARRWPPRPGTSWRYGVVLGACGETSQARRTFLDYLAKVRPRKRWRKQMLHYNSWFDMHSWQDDEFFSDLRIYNFLKKQDMTEQLTVERVEEFNEALVRNHSLPLDSYLWDDGWDNPKTLWDFDRARFPNGFTKVAAVAQSTGSGIGVWLSPWGGYGTAKKQRVKLGRHQGYETNEGGFSLAGPRYFARFRDAVLSMRRDYHVNLFKFDGVAGDATEVAEEMEAMLTLIDEIRTTASGANGSRTSNGNSSEDKSSNSDKVDPWINLTTGTWPSPFFLLWADSIWRGGGDVGTLRLSQLVSLTVRQRWIIWRELLVFRNVVMRARFFPLQQLMIHGVVLGLHGEALLRGLHQHTELDFAQEAWSFVGMGLQLQELYLTPSLLEPADWSNLAEALKWSRANLDVLADSHWVLGNFEDLQPYGVASWRPTTRGRPGRGFLMLRNPLPKPQQTGAFTLDRVLEMPASELGMLLQVSIVRSLSDGPERLGCVIGLPHGESGKCVIEATNNTTTQLRSAEVLILAVEVVEPNGTRKPSPE